MAESARGRTDPRRAELADFLRTRRAALTPEVAGLPPTARRRTPGLRREEVAELAGISVALYTWLEQGRDISVSARAIDAIASALQLTSGERTHIHRLVRRASGELREEPSPGLRRVIASLRDHPAYVLDHAWNVVLRNAAAFHVFGGAAEPDARTNLLEEVFIAPRMRELFSDWESMCEGLLEIFRLDFALFADDPGAIALVERLREASELFATIWEKHGVREYPNTLREVAHPTAGRLVFTASAYGVMESPGLRLLLFAPQDDQTAARVAELTKGGFDAVRSFRS
jgi:transcriptional regulator with XRE-family HTH domain